MPFTDMQASRLQCRRNSPTATIRQFCYSQPSDHLWWEEMLVPVVCCSMLWERTNRAREISQKIHKESREKARTFKRGEDRSCLAQTDTRRYSNITCLGGIRSNWTSRRCLAGTLCWRRLIIVSLEQSRKEQTVDWECDDEWVGNEHRWVSIWTR